MQQYTYHGGQRVPYLVLTLLLMMQFGRYSKDADKIDPEGVREGRHKQNDEYALSGVLSVDEYECEEEREMK